MQQLETYNDAVLSASSRLQEYGSLVELGARVGVKIRERDDTGSIKVIHEK